MDPQTTPPIEPTPAPQNASEPNPISTSPEVVSPSPLERPAQKAELPNQYERPVAPWPPNSAVSQPDIAPQLAQDPIAAATPTPQVDPLAPAQTGPTVDQQVMGREVTDAAEMQQNIDSTSSNLQVGINTNPMLDGSAPLMTDNQASTLFQEGASTKKLLSHNKHKRLLKRIGLALGLILVILIAYIFLYGNRVAQSYKDGSSITTYKDAFTEISSALDVSPVDSSKLESGLNKLKIAENNQNKIGSVFLGNYNPNYKKAKLISTSTAEYKKSTKEYQEKYSFNKFLTGLSSIGITIDNLGKLNSENYATLTYEQLAVKITNLTTDCSTAIAEVKDAAKPSDLSLASDSFIKALGEICASINPIYQEIITAKTGLISNEDQDRIKLALVGINNSVTSIVNGSGISSFYINQLTSYSRAAEQDSKNLLQSAEKILNT
jgi:hypothetical protein